MSNNRIYLYSNKYKGIDKDGYDSKFLRISYLNKYKNAVEFDNIWMEKHYFQKLLTCISYDNFPDYIVKRLYKVFEQRAEYLSLYYFQFCKGIEDDEVFNSNAERNNYLHQYTYCFKTTPNQISHYSKNFNDDIRSLFKMYQYKGFASEKAIQQYKECMHLFKYSHMESDMIDYFKRNNIEYIPQKTFSDLLSPLGNLLRFDAFVNKNGQPLLFECQGEQHYRPIEFFGGKETYLRQCEYDNIKKQYCIDNNIPLLCIKYNQNVVLTIQKFLQKKNYRDIIYEYA